MAVTVANMSFMKEDSCPKDEKPYVLLYQPLDDLPLQNFEETYVTDIPIHDMRPILQDLSLERQGFVVRRLASALRYEDFTNAERLQAVYGEEVRAQLLSLLNARAAFIHECVIRQRGSRAPAENHGFGQPVASAHTDYTPAYVTKLIGQLTGLQKEAVEQMRYRMVNVWRPLRGPVRDWPLALCDLQSLREGDLCPTDEVHAKDTLESHLVVYKPHQKWYFLSEQQADEALIFVSTDSEMKAEVPHGSFLDPRHTDALPRESIECRVLVVY